MMTTALLNGPSDTSTGLRQREWRAPWIEAPGGCGCGCGGGHNRKRGMGDLPTFFTDLTAGNFSQAFTDLFTNIDTPTLILLAVGGFFLYRTFSKARRSYSKVRSAKRRASLAELDEEFQRRRKAIRGNRYRRQRA